MSGCCVILRGIAISAISISHREETRKHFVAVCGQMHASFWGHVSTYALSFFLGGSNYLGTHSLFESFRSVRRFGSEMY